MTLDELYAQAAVVTASGSKSFYFATRFFPPDLARAAHAVYWFCRHTDDLVDEAPSVEQGSAALEQWSGWLESLLSGETPAHPVLRVFGDALERYGIPHEYPRELIEGMRMDLHAVRYETFEDLRVFCYRVASVVGLMMSYVIGFEGPALTYAIDLGIAMQLTNILRDIGEDLQRGRVYLPLEDLARFGYTEHELRGHVRNDAFRALMNFQAARASEFYEKANPGIALLDPRGRFAVRIASDVYRAILRQIEANEYDSFTRRAVVPPMQKYWITARGLAVPMARRALRSVGV